jgi:nucleotide-binding universal stress UspA family protein
MKTLFVATDFSAAGNNAVRFAAHYAADFETRLVVFYAVHMPSFHATIGEAELLQVKKDAEETKRKELDAVVNDIYQELGLKRSEKITAAAKIGPFAADTIMGAADDCQADLLILGTHGSTGMKLLGSITTEIIFNAKTPVLAIPPQCVYKRIESMVYATDLRNTVNELRCIVPIAIKMNAEIEVLNLDFDKHENKPILDVQNWEKQLNYDRIKMVVQKEIPGMTIVEQMEQYLQKRKPEIMVMFPEERSVFDKVFVRSKTEELAYQAMLPLLTFLKSSVK